MVDPIALPGDVSQVAMDRCHTIAEWLVTGAR